MADNPPPKLSPPPPGKAADPKPAPPVASGNPPGQTAPVVNPVSAASSVPLFGGFRGGRKRKDGLRPGSPEALAADRQTNAAHNRLTRAAALAAAPPAPLPSAVAPLAVAPMDKTLPALPGVGAVPIIEIPVLALAWEARDLLPVTENGVPLLEEMAARQIIAKGKRARLPLELIHEIEHDCKWPDKSKKMLAETSGALAAKYLNKAGISAEYKIEVNFSIAVLNIAANHMAILRRLDKLIAAANVQPAPAAPEKEKK